MWQIPYPCDADAIATGDGLFSRSSGSPTVPHWVGSALFNMVLSEKSENDKYAKHLRSSAGVAVFIGERADPANWFEVGRAYEHFALAATARGVRTAFVNQPVEVPALRSSSVSGWGWGRSDPTWSCALAAAHNCRFRYGVGWPT
jgi:hypothetical protein